MSEHCEVCDVEVKDLAKHSETKKHEAAAEIFKRGVKNGRKDARDKAKKKAEKDGGAPSGSDDVEAVLRKFAYRSGAVEVVGDPSSPTLLRDALRYHREGRLLVDEEE